jgi:hypothetical protein
LENFWIFFATRSDYNKSSGNDVGNAIPQWNFYHNEEQKKRTEEDYWFNDKEDTFGSEL